MIKQQLERHLITSGYYILPSYIPEFSAFVKIENNLYNIILMVDYKKGVYISTDQYEEVKDSLMHYFTNVDTDIHIMSLVLFEDINKAKTLVEDDVFCWFLDIETKELIIEEDRVVDFYGLKGYLQQFLTDFVEVPDEPDEIHSEEEMSHFFTRQKYFLKSTTKVTAFLVLVNILLFILCQFYGDFIYSKGQIGLTYIMQNEFYRLLTSIFLHVNLDHISSNMILLIFAGSMLERIIDERDYAIVFFVSGIMGNVVSCVYEFVSGISMVSIGASGAIYGIIGSLFCIVVRQKPPVAVSISRMILMIAYCLYSSFVGTNINVAAHIGGLVTGFFLTMLLTNIRMRRQKA